MRELKRRIDIENRNRREAFGAFYCVYTHDCHFWEAIVTMRRLLLALLASFVPFNDPVSRFDRFPASFPLL